MQINAAGLAIIKRWEDLCLDPKPDARNTWQIGYGHQVARGDPLFRRITEAEAEAILQSDLRRFEEAVTRLVTFALSPGEGRGGLSENQFSALVSLVYNIGVGALQSSDLLRWLNAGEFEAAADEFLRWNKARYGDHNNQLWPRRGLISRRREERELFMS